MGASLEELLSNSPPSETTPPSSDPTPAPAASEVQASSDPVPTPAPSEASGQDTPADPPIEGDLPAEPKGDGTDGTGTTNDGPPPSPGAAKNDSDDPKVRAFQKKAQDETRKRQELEKQLKETVDRLAALEQKLTPAPAQPAPAPQPQRGLPPAAQRPAPPPRRGPPPPNPDVDPGGAVRYLANQQQAALRQLAEDRARDRLEMAITTSQEIARMRFPDYDEIETVFADEADQNPHLYQQMYRSPNPAQFAYEMGQKIKGLKEIGNDPLAWRAQQEAAIRAQVEAEFAAKQQQAPPAPAPGAPAPSPAHRQAAPQRPAPPSPPPSLAGATSAAPRNPQARYEGPTPLEKLLG
jgi:hypothetical protein